MQFFNIIYHWYKTKKMLFYIKAGGKRIENKYDFDPVYDINHRIITVFFRLLQKQGRGA